MPESCLLLPSSVMLVIFPVSWRSEELTHNFVVTSTEKKIFASGSLSFLMLFFLWFPKKQTGAGCSSFSFFYFFFFVDCF